MNLDTSPSHVLLVGHRDGVCVRAGSVVVLVVRGQELGPVQPALAPIVPRRWSRHGHPVLGRLGHLAQVVMGAGQKPGGGLATDASTGEAREQGLIWGVEPPAVGLVQCHLGVGDPLWVVGV